MPDSAKNFSYDGTNGPISTTTVTRAELITAMEHLNYAEGYNIRAIDELAGSGLVSVDSLGNAYARSISGDNGLTVSNATGISGNPTIGIGTPSTVRQAITDTEANTITNSVMVSILSTGTSYAVPAAETGVITQKYIINDTAHMITLTGSVWADASITTVRIPPEGMIFLTSNTTGKWWEFSTFVPDAYGAIYVSSAAATTTGAGTFVEDASTYSLGSSVANFALGSDSRLVYTGKIPIHAAVNASISATSSASNLVSYYKIMHYDASATTTSGIDSSEQRRKIGTGSDVGNISVHADLVMEENDYVYLGIDAASATNITTNFSYIAVDGTPIMTT